MLVNLNLFVLFWYFSNTICQPPHPTASKHGRQADTARPAESHRLHLGFPHGRRRGITEAIVSS